MTEVCKNVMDLGEEKKTKKYIHKKNNESYLIWLLGCLLSFVPMIASSLFPLMLKSTPKDYNVFFAIFSNISIIYISISISVSALNHYLSNAKYNKVSFYIVFIVVILGTIMYGMFTIARDNPDFNTDFLFYFNIIFFFSALLVGSSLFIKN